MLSGNGSSSSSKRRKLPAGPPPDFTLGNKLRSDYNLVQSRYMAAVQVRSLHLVFVYGCRANDAAHATPNQGEYRPSSSSAKSRRGRTTSSR